MFRDPLYLIGVVLGPLAVLAAAALGEARRAQLTALFGLPATLSRLMPAEAAARRRLKLGLRAAGVGLLFLALAGPQWGVELVPTQSKTRHVMIAIDTSLSMLTEDVHPSRMEKAKEDMSLLLDQLKGDQVGVIAFAGEPAIVCPVTSDLDAARQLLQEIAPGIVPVPGTGIGKAIRLATTALGRYPGTKALILISDGEDHKTDPEGAADQAAAAGIRIFSIGVGTSDGGPIPLRDSSGALTGYKKDRQGRTVISRLGASTLADAAKRTQGVYYQSSPADNEVSEIADQIEQFEKTQGLPGGQTAYKNHFLLPLWAGFLLLLLELALPERAGAAEEARRLARVPAALLPLVLALLAAAAPARAATAESDLRQGNKLYDQEQYQPALDDYFLAGQRSPNDPRPVFNAGDALFRLQQYDKAADAFKAVAESQAPAPARAQAYYNLGNTQFSAQQYKDAVDSYRKSLILDPADAAARHNLAVALHYLKNPPPKSKNQNKNQQDQKQQPQQQPKPNSGGQQNQPQNSDQGKPPEARTRPQDQLSKEDAERILRAVSDKEKSLAKQMQLQKKPPQHEDVEEDW